MKKAQKVKKIVGLSPEPLAKLEELKVTKRRTYTQIIEDLLMGRDRFAPDVEAWIESRCARQGLPRDIVIERAILQAMNKQTGTSRHSTG